MGIADSIVQTYAYWIMGPIANTPNVLSRYAGCYKGVQSLGAMFSWMLEWQLVAYKIQLLVCIGLAIAFIPPTMMVAMMVKDRGAEDDDDDDAEERTKSSEGLDKYF
ncbi:hypothetical protein SARC_09318 [Sphaeroforma arctica JP610]|uniref:Uncharacterized protein n=1 Tax=Sphaeroforma arctica JP610 TaxID=667725 RepID=A0A0L0FQG6_9EUKA|nr:hypothetical protein SARC_09318 [Sphaeroforma arctica JP610]KNC78243.1 hypothetical protein SARC_09318 [Sphaeroforma arctica JP610]|eukprot:XP_014152145.1 hypothetical protein SARC_09318 [Sphaeroforma arctica JP610]